MKNLIQNTTETAFYLTSAYIHPGDTVIDATCGNGYDTLRLAQKHPGRLLAFDLQQKAVDATRALLIENGFSEELAAGRFQLFQESHEKIDTYLTDPAAAILFNLGYLPGGDKSFTTLAASTLTAVNKALNLLKQNGILCITMYSGHSEGAREKNALLNWAATLNPSCYHAGYLNLINQKNNPPEVLVITRKK